MKKLGEYINGNCKVTLFDDGTKIRFTPDDEFLPVKPESMDLKITNRCTGTNCAFCHERSGPEGDHGDIMNLKFIDTLLPYTEIACLSGDTYVFTESGPKKIQDLKIGDQIYDRDGILRGITQITTKIENPVLLKGNKGIRILCSEDHPLITRGMLTPAVQMEGKYIDGCPQIEECLYDEETPTIDLAEYIHSKSDKVGSRGGKVFGDAEVRIANSSRHLPRYLKVDEEVMWLYGLFVAEGSRKGLTLNINETEYADKAAKIWEKITGHTSTIYKNEHKHSLVIELQSASEIEAIFVEALQIGHGARAKTIDYLFKLKNKKLIKAAIVGMWQGDGCERMRPNKKTGESGKYRSFSYKTTSEKIAYSLLYLLAKHFGIYASLAHGMSPERKIEGRTLEATDYYAVEFYGEENAKKIFGEEMPGQYQLKHQPPHSPKIEKITTEKSKIKLYDITLDGGSHIFPINGYVLTHNCGGGNVLEHPDFVPFLEKCKARNLICNVTFNQVHFMQNLDFIESLIEKKLIYGVGVSLNASKEKAEELSQVLSAPLFKNAVVHVINGIHSLDVLKPLMDKGIKILILGYKTFGRGVGYGELMDPIIKKNQQRLKDKLPSLIPHFKAVSFDNLAINQLGVKDILSPEQWDSFYMGEEGQFTMYIDAVKGEYAVCSIAEERFPLLDDIEPMFQHVRKITGHAKER